MSNYRRLYAPNSMFFFTLVTYKRRKIFTSNLSNDLLKDCIKKVKNNWPFEIIAFVLLPDHLHAIWKMPENDEDYSMRWRLIKSNFTRNYYKQSKGKLNVNSCRNLKGERCIWQRRFWEHRIRDEDDFTSHIDYIHYNPVKHGYVDAPRNWKYSSFKHFVKREWYPENWSEGDGKHILSHCVGE
ncbi:transposase [bacterium]|nr:transposase [bacterium]